MLARGRELTPISQLTPPPPTLLPPPLPASSDCCRHEDARASVELVRSGAPTSRDFGSYKAGPAEDPVILTVCLVVTGIALARPQAIRNPVIAP
jgi:hypothetical protein